jgi:hypothetical protein
MIFSYVGHDLGGLAFGSGSRRVSSHCVFLNMGKLPEGLRNLPNVPVTAGFTSTEIFSPVGSLIFRDRSCPAEFIEGGGNFSQSVQPARKFHRFRPPDEAGELIRV